MYQETILELTKQASLGVVATIPNLISLPYFTTITIKQLIQGATKVNPAFNTLYTKALDPSTGNYKTIPAKDNDLIVLSFNTSQLGAVVNGLPGYGLIPQNPLVSKEVLDAAEVAKV